MKKTKNLAVISQAGFILFLTIVSVLHFLRPDKNMLSSFVSEYAVGNYNWVMTAGFYLLTMASAALLVGLLLGIKASKKGMVTFGIFCIGSILIAIFPTDVPVIPPTFHGLIHGFAALIALIDLPIAMIFLGYVFKENENWKSLAKPSLFFGLTSLVLFIIFFACPNTLKGIAERILLIWDVCWLLLVSNKLYSNSLMSSS